MGEKGNRVHGRGGANGSGGLMVLLWLQEGARGYRGASELYAWGDGMAHGIRKAYLCVCAWARGAGIHCQGPPPHVPLPSLSHRL